MDKNSYILDIGKIKIRCSFRYKDTASFFHGFISDNNTNQNVGIIKINSFDEEVWRKSGSKMSSHAEYSLFCGRVSDYMLNNRACLVHAVAFKRKNKAYLIMGEPGIGKSTQIKYLMELYPNEFSIICGDRPCLKFEDDGKIMVYPTPWNGKEGWHGANECELCCLFYLVRGEQTKITRLNEKEAVLPVFSSIISRREDENSITTIGKLCEHIIKKYPVFKYINGGVPHSTKDFYDTICIED